MTFVGHNIALNKCLLLYLTIVGLPQFSSVKLFEKPLIHKIEEKDMFETTIYKFLQGDYLM